MMQRGDIPLLQYIQRYTNNRGGGITEKKECCSILPGIFGQRRSGQLFGEPTQLFSTVYRKQSRMESS